MNNKSNPVLSFLKGKGFYLALAACIAVAAGCSFFAIRNMMRQLTEAPSSNSITGDTQWNIQTPVENKQEDVPVTSGPASSSAPSSSSRPSAGSSSQQPIASPAPEEPADVSAPLSVRPVAGPTLQAFSGNELEYNETLKDWRTHNGVDLSAEKGEIVKCIEGGTVKAAYEDGNWGGVVEVDCNGVTMRYAGLSTPLKITEGQAVEAGQQLGLVNEVPCETAAGYHLHFEVSKDGAYQDPASYLD